MKRKPLSKLLPVALAAALCLSMGAAAFGDDEVQDNPLSAVSDVMAEDAQADGTATQADAEAATDEEVEAADQEASEDTADDSAAVTASTSAASSSAENQGKKATALADEESSGLYLDGNAVDGPITISEDGTYTITGTYVLGENDGTAAITVAENVKADITLNGVNITVEGESGKHKAGIYAKDGATVNLTLVGENQITGVVVDATGEVISTGVIGMCIGGSPADSASSKGGTTVTIAGSGSLGIDTVGTGISLTTGNTLAIDGTTVNIDSVYMMDTTISGIGIYSNGELAISNGANVSISDVNLQNQSGTHISYNNGYGIDSQNGGTITITGSNTVVNIADCYKAGIYSSYSYDDGTGEYSGNTITVGDNAALNISVNNEELTSSSGIRMENHGEIDVSGNASLNVDGFTHWGITIGYEGNINVSGSGSAINLTGTSGTHTSATVGIYAERDVEIVVDDEAKIDIKNVTGSGIDFEKGTSGTDGVFVSNGTLNIANAGAGIYAMGGTTSIEFTDGATVSMDVEGNCIGSDGKSATGHVLMSGKGTTVSLDGGYVFALNYKYMEIADQAVVNVTANGDAISLGNWSGGGASLVVTGDAKLAIDSGAYTGIATYGASHYVEVSDGGIVTMTGDDGTGIALSKPTTMYVSDATLLIDNTDGIVVSGADNLLYEDSLSHIEATNIYSANGGEMDFIVMGGTLTYDFNHESNIWPYNATDIAIGGFADAAFEVNETAVDRSITYGKDEALVNFIVPSNENHLTFDAMYQTLADTYSYQSDAAKEGDTLSIWVPGVEVYYNFDENTDLLNTDLTDKYVSDLEAEGVDFVLQYEDTTEPYDMVIRGKSIAFSAESVTDNAITLKYGRIKDGTVVDHVLTDPDGIPALYTTAYTASTGDTYGIQWYYGNTELADGDSVTDNGPLQVFDAYSSVVRTAAANAYGILVEQASDDTGSDTDTDTDTDSDTASGKTDKGSTGSSDTSQTSGTQKGGSDMPQTGDGTPLAVVAILALAALAAAAIARYRMHRSSSRGLHAR